MNLSDQLLWNDSHFAPAGPSVTLLSGIAAGLAPLPYVREVIKIRARALVHRRTTRRWLSLLNSHPAFSEFVQHRPSVLYKIYRPYLTATLDIGQRLAVLSSHYEFVFGHGLAGMLTQASRSGVTLARVDGKSGVPYELHLRAVGTLEREGELVLQLREAGSVVYSTAFTFSTQQGRQLVSIGCVQGPRHADGLAAIKQATRELHGVRPKQLLVSLVQQLGFALGCEQLRLVGNANRTAGRAIGRGQVLADYDQLWQEMGASQRADGDFALPCLPLAPLDLEQIASKKRSEARKRHQVVGELAEAMICQLRAGRP